MEMIEVVWMMAERKSEWDGIARGKLLSYGIRKVHGISIMLLSLDLLFSGISKVQKS